MHKINYILGAIAFAIVIILAYLNISISRERATLSAPEFYPYMKFSLQQEDFDQYPHTMDSVLNALETWALALPAQIEWDFDELALDGFPITVVDIEKIPGYDGFGILGMTMPSRGTIWLDDSLENDPDPTVAYRVTLHELGHLFGLPHFIGYDFRHKVNGDLIVGDDEKAKKHIMYPWVSLSSAQGLSTLEIEIVRKHLYMSRFQEAYRCGERNH